MLVKGALDDACMPDWYDLQYNIIKYVIGALLSLSRWRHVAYKNNIFYWHKYRSFYIWIFKSKTALYSVIGAESFMTLKCTTINAAGETNTHNGK